MASETQRLRVCPNCKSGKVRRSRSQSTSEFLLSRLLLRRPYRCEVCEQRFFDVIWAKRDPKRVRAESTPED